MCRYDACDVQGLVRHYCTVNHYNFPFFEVRAAPWTAQMLLTGLPPPAT